MTRIVSTKEYEHGTHARYVLNLCRCPECREAARVYNAAQRYRLEPAFVAAGPARDHIAMLTAAGVGLKTIAKTSGLSTGTLSKLVYGHHGRAPSKRIRKDTLDRILGVMPNQIAGGAKVDATATWRLVDEMIAAGVPKSKIARAIGQQGPGLQLRRTTVSARNARAVLDVHARWSAGELVLTRDHRHTGPVAINPTATAPRPGADISDLILDLAEVVETRNAEPWRAQAACRNRPSYLWFPAPDDAKTTEYALKICASCLVRAECRAANIDQPVGIYGGLTPKARKAAHAEPDLDRQVRVDFGPLERYIATAYAPDDATQFVTRGERTVTDGRIADLVGANRATIARWRDTGTLTERAARACATRLGIHPTAIWSDLRRERAA